MPAEIVIVADIWVRPEHEERVELLRDDIEHTYGAQLDRVTRGGGKGQLAGKISCVRIERNSRLS